MGQLTLIRHTLRSLNNVWCECVYVGVFVCVYMGEFVCGWVLSICMSVCVFACIDFVVAVNIIA